MIRKFFREWGSVILLAIVVTSVIACLIACQASDIEKRSVATKNGYGIQFEKIADVGKIGTDYSELYYDVSTKIVYLYVSGVKRVSCTPYMMLDSFGCMTVAVYDEQTGMIGPAEFSGDYVTETDNGITEEMRGMRTNG